MTSQRNRAGVWTGHSMQLEHRGRQWCEANRQVLQGSMSSIHREWGAGGAMVQRVAWVGGNCLLSRVNLLANRWTPKSHICQILPNFGLTYSNKFQKVVKTKCNCHWTPLGSCTCVYVFNLLLLPHFVGFFLDRPQLLVWKDRSMMLPKLEVMDSRSAFKDWGLSPGNSQQGVDSRELWQVLLLPPSNLK